MRKQLTKKRINFLTHGEKWIIHKIAQSPRFKNLFCSTSFAERARTIANHLPNANDYHLDK